MARTTPISGFPEWTPAQRAVEQQVLDELRRVFELHGFPSIETRAVEPVAQLLRKGEIDKEVYGVRRLASRAEGSSDDELALHFDLTVPFARYVLEHAGSLQFPFRRYQVQKVWRGERPQEGRYREFAQADIDVVDRDTLSFGYEVEMPLVMAEAFEGLRRLGLPAMTIRVSNRRLAEGFYLGLGLDDPTAVLRAVDKLDKIGPDGVRRDLLAVGASDAQVDACLALASIRSSGTGFVDQVRALGSRHDLLDQGLEELAAVVGAAERRAPGALVADLSIARGLDYYTGTVYETTMAGFEQHGSACSGGRYDSLASDGKVTYPGVGISFGVTRVLGLLFGRGLTASRSVPTVALVAVTDEERRPDAEAVAGALRGRGISALVSPAAEKFGKQIRFADRRGIPYVWFVGAGEAGGDQVKDIRSGEQVDSDAASWTPPAQDLRPQVVPAGE
ncbi:histidine--tRNA ligase [Angustibacter speluncae]